jgi:hypothetical protein
MWFLKGKKLELLLTNSKGEDVKLEKQREWSREWWNGEGKCTSVF